MATTLAPARKSARRLPGEAGVWVFIVGDMLVFALFFVTFAHYRSQDIALYVQSQATLSQGYGVVNTLLMLTSSWFVALGVQGVRAAAGRYSARLFAAAFACGVAFVAVKYFEYGEKIRAGVGLTSNDFYMYYFMFTGIHLLHVLIGLGVLAFLWRIARAAGREQGHIVALESGACFWHLVDVLWIVLFALLYLMK